MAMPSMAMMRRPRPGPSAGADPHAAPDSANARNRSPQPVPFTLAAWIAPGPQQVGFSVIPPGLVIPPPTTSFPPGLVIPAKAGIPPSEELLCARVAWSFPHPPVIPVPTTSFPHPPRHSRTHLVIPAPTSSFPRRRESPVALLDAPLGESPSPAVMHQKETVSRNLESPRVPMPSYSSNRRITNTAF